MTPADCALLRIAAQTQLGSTQPSCLATRGQRCHALAVDSCAWSPPVVYAEWPDKAPHPCRILSETEDKETHPFVLLSGYGAPGGQEQGAWSYAGLHPSGQATSFEDAHRRVTLQGRTGSDLHVPFSGGAVGYVSYDAGWAYAAKPRRVRADPMGMPSTLFRFYDTIYARHEPSGRAVIITRNEKDSERKADLLLSRLTSSHKLPTRGHLSGQLRPRITQADFEAKVGALLGLIEDGDIYQTNMTYPLEGRYEGHPAASFIRLAAQPPPFSAYLSLNPNQHIVSASPECLMQVDADRMIRSYPIKGTKRRDAAPEAEIASLLHDPKEQAEHTMIVDLIRNDLGRVCKTGSVHVPRLRYPETFKRLHHLTSCVQGKLREDCTPRELMQAIMPGGSITGAPKLRSMEVIDALEEEPRGIYCGSIMWVDSSGALCGNVAIRTAQISQGWVRFGVGGGIVADSKPEQEWQETKLKAEALGAALRGTDRVFPQQTWPGRV